MGKLRSGQLAMNTVVREMALDMAQGLYRFDVVEQLWSIYLGNTKNGQMH